MSFKMNCPKCDVELHILEQPMGVPGGKEKEQAYCPKCNTLAYECMTDGFLRVTVIDGDDND